MKVKYKKKIFHCNVLVSSFVFLLFPIFSQAESNSSLTQTNGTSAHFQQVAYYSGYGWHWHRPLWVGHSYNAYSDYDYSNPDYNGLDYYNDIGALYRTSDAPIIHVYHRVIPVRTVHVVREIHVYHHWVSGHRIHHRIHHICKRWVPGHWERR